eukprot:NODE_637_length_1988_cov_176.296077_g590_i0.p1 GENE.NODE_637_length_1988_cov_176.296077_g590_i0~~NODE_637_length_1988_cov_176.296077_g590_i0.p1  ORF type:complete len:637 (-),score=205.53 NODE_637_length_1988_cov_176.296077_g590_i0:76-1929(-)
MREKRVLKYSKKLKKKNIRFQRKYLARAQATRKLDISLAVFKKLCIIKGVYPRLPSHLPTRVGRRKEHIYYRRIDINDLMQDPLLAVLRKNVAFQRRVKKKLIKGDHWGAKSFKQVKEPAYILAPIIKERYPTFAHALKELEDALCHVSLFASLAPELECKSCINNPTKLPTALAEKSKLMMKKFNTYVQQTNSLRKTFLSVKGIYYEADIDSVRTVWMVPYFFSIKMPSEVDGNVMITFLEFYLTFLEFVMFRLEHDLKVKAMEKVEKEDDDPEDGMAEDFPMSSVEEQKAAEKKRCSNTFKGLNFFIGRENPIPHLTFVIRSFGGTVTERETDTSITHQVMDRPTISNRNLTREYIQPQWVFDSANCRFLLPVEPYAPGQALPPHLSPFDKQILDKHGKAYEPDRLKYIQQLMDPTIKVTEKTDGKEESESEAEVSSQSDDGQLPSQPHLNDGRVTDDEDDEQQTAAAIKAGPQDDSSDSDVHVEDEPPVKWEDQAQCKRDKAKGDWNKRIARKKKQEELQLRASMLSSTKRAKWRSAKKHLAKKSTKVHKIEDKKRLLDKGQYKIVDNKYLITDSQAKKDKKKDKMGIAPWTKRKPAKKGTRTYTAGQEAIMED